ncbi:MAG: hypothetical protein ACYS0F_07970 [Planctomycetota bacterium]|jgi:hypothetical protein
MSEEIEVGPQAEQAVMMAVLAAGDPSNEKAWKARVQRTLPLFAALLRGGYGYWGKEAQKVIESQVFTGEFLGMELEESSKRIIVHIRSASGDNSTESIRTERTDVPPGWHMQRKLEDLAVGTKIVAFKYMEQIGFGKDAKKVRVLVHFEPIVRSKKSAPNNPAHHSTRSSEPSGQEGSGGQAASRSPGVSSSPPQEDQTLSAAAEAVQKAMSEMQTRQKLAVKNRCVGANITDWADPGPESFDRVMTIIGEIAHAK